MCDIPQCMTKDHYKVQYIATHCSVCSQHPSITYHWDTKVLLHKAYSTNLRINKLCNFFFLNRNLMQHSFSSLSLKAPLAPDHHESSTQSCDQGQLDGGGSIAQVGAAAVPGDGVVHIQDRSSVVYAGSVFYTALVMDIQQVSSKLWMKRRRYTLSFILFKLLQIIY